jgi:hypothetical protein
MAERGANQGTGKQRARCDLVGLLTAPPVLSRESGDCISRVDLSVDGESYCIVARGPAAEKLSAIPVGALVRISGELRMHRWRTKDQRQCLVLDVLANEIEEIKP